MGDMTIALQFVTLYDDQQVFMWSIYLLDLGTDFLVGNKVFILVYKKKKKPSNLS